MKKIKRFEVGDRVISKAKVMDRVRDKKLSFREDQIIVVSVIEYEGYYAYSVGRLNSNGKYDNSTSWVVEGDSIILFSEVKTFSLGYLLDLINHWQTMEE